MWIFAMLRRSPCCRTTHLEVFNEKIALFVSEQFLLQSYGWVFENLCWVSGFLFLTLTHPLGFCLIPLLKFKVLFQIELVNSFVFFPSIFQSYISSSTSI
jgi:hypothetical protein